MMIMRRDEWLRDLGFTDAEIETMRAEVKDRLRRGKMPAIRPLTDDGDTNTDIAASRLEDMKSRPKDSA